VDCAAGQVPGREKQWAVGLMPEIGGIVVVCRRTRCGEGRIRTPAGGSNSHSFLRRTVVPETDRLARGGEMGTESHRAYIIDGSSLLPKLRVCQVHKPILLYGLRRTQLMSRRKPGRQAQQPPPRKCKLSSLAHSSSDAVSAQVGRHTAPG
jgi:hypothetical protein